MKVAFIYTGAGIMKAIPETFFNVLDDDFEYANYLDDGVLKTIITDGQVTEATNRRIQDLYDKAALEKPDVIVCTCSSIGETVEEAGKRLAVPVIRIDEAMARKAVGIGDKIAVMATLQSTVDPTCRLIEKFAKEQGKEVSITKIVMENVMALLMTGNIKEALRILLQEARKVQEQVDVLVLAQASLDSAKGMLENACTIPVLSSPQLCAETLVQYQ